MRLQLLCNNWSLKKQTNPNYMIMSIKYFVLIIMIKRSCCSQILNFFHQKYEFLILSFNRIMMKYGTKCATRSLLNHDTSTIHETFPYLLLSNSLLFPNLILNILNRQPLDALSQLNCYMQFLSYGIDLLISHYS